MHERCLMQWIRRVKRQNIQSKQLRCEICNYRYRWRKRIKPLNQWTFPPCIDNDRNWHIVFGICSFLMIISIITIVICISEDNQDVMRSQAELHKENISSSIPKPHSSGDSSDKNTVNRIHQKHTKGGKYSQSREKFSYSNHKSSSSELDSIDHLDRFNLPSSRISSRHESKSDEMDLDNSIRNILRELGHRCKINTSSCNRLEKLISAFLSDRNFIAYILRDNDQVDNLPNGLLLSDPVANKPKFESFHNIQHQTKIEEIFVIFGGCIFFICFFLATFSQIKSRISLYKMIISLIEHNQQWNIGEFELRDEISRDLGSESSRILT
ncbi:hypothetical protein SSS_06961 [Sarcoptes scabiei]|uniref:RING-CH-type domain-containing protein n=1 Tax=Sarcoptes scabiei TaxID=52283 RepID=A0A834RGD6_SARSC|nr:hypothetical protein SSS_06961 [Sarcoptes scabiei]